MRSGRGRLGAALAALGLLLLAWAGPALAQSQVLHLNWPSQQDRSVRVTEIEMTGTQIIVTLNIRNTSSRIIQPRIFPPGHPLSFYILEKSTGRRHYLAGSRGLAVDPNYTALGPGRSVTFKLYFTQIPLASFSLMEGEPNLRHTIPGSIFWDFLNIDLGKMAEKFKAADRPPPKPDHVWKQPGAPKAKAEPKEAPKPKEPVKPKEEFKFIEQTPESERTCLKHIESSREHGRAKKTIR